MSEKVSVLYGERPFEKEADVSDWQSRYESFSNKQLRREYWNYKSSDDLNGSKGMALAEIVDLRRGPKTIDRFFREADLTPSDLGALDLYKIMVNRGYDVKETNLMELKQAIIDSGYNTLYAGSVDDKGYVLPVEELDAMNVRGFVKKKIKRAKEIQNKLNSGESLK